MTKGTFKYLAETEGKLMIDIEDCGLRVIIKRQKDKLPVLIGTGREERHGTDLSTARLIVNNVNAICENPNFVVSDGLEDALKQEMQEWKWNQVLRQHTKSSGTLNTMHVSPENQEFLGTKQMRIDAAKPLPMYLHLNVIGSVIRLPIDSDVRIDAGAQSFVEDLFEIEGVKEVFRKYGADIQPTKE